MLARLLFPVTFNLPIMEEKNENSFALHQKEISEQGENGAEHICMYMEKMFEAK
jgi:hypothetical protein